MRVFLNYLWKEWRDHRAVLLGMLLAVPLLLVVMGLSLPRTALDVAGQRADFPEFAALACLALFVVSLATDLAPGEARRGHRWFLERLPGGLGAAFRGKLALFALGGALFTAYGYAAGAVTCRLVGGEWPPLPSLGTTTWILAIVALWAFAVSCCLPRGALSLPAVAALALLLALPAILLWMIYPSRFPEAWWRWESGALWTVGAVVAAWAAFRRRGFLRAGRACLTVGALCAMPYWADAAHDAWDWNRHSVIAIHQVLLGEGGRFAFVNRLREGTESRTSPAGPMIVDLRAGTAREAGSRLSRFYPDWTWSRQVEYAYVDLWRAGDEDSVVLDGRTGEPTKATDEERRAASRARPVWRFPDGRVAWFEGGRLVAGAAGEKPEVLIKHGSSPCGLGVECWTPHGYYDFVRERFFLCRGLALRGDQVWIRPGAWLTRRKCSYQLFDPDANAYAPALGLEETTQLASILDDGRVLACRKGEGLVVVTPETGETVRVPMPPGFEGAFAYHREPIRTPGGRRVFQLIKDGRAENPLGPFRCAFLRFDGEVFTATAATVGYVTLLGCPADDEVIAHDDRAIYRLRFGSDEKEEIWRAR